MSPVRCVVCTVVQQTQVTGVPHVSRACFHYSRVVRPTWSQLTRWQRGNESV